MPFHITEWESMCFTTQSSRILYLSTLNVTISVAKTRVLFALHTAMESVHTMKVPQYSQVTRETDRQYENYFMFRRLFNCSCFCTITEIHSITLNTSVHTVIYSIYRVILYNLFCTLPLRAPLILQRNRLCFLQLATDFQFY